MTLLAAWPSWNPLSNLSRPLMRNSAGGNSRLPRCAAQRVVLLSYDKATDRISFRHFSIRVAPSGVTKSLKGLLAGDRLPDMHNFADVSEFLTRSGYGSVRRWLQCCDFWTLPFAFGTETASGPWSSSSEHRYPVRARAGRPSLPFALVGISPCVGFQRTAGATTPHRQLHG